MNIKITKEEAFKLFEREEGRDIIGSYLYGTQKENSDKDYIIFYKSFSSIFDHILQIRHQFQWDDEENNIDYIFTTRNQFLMNLLSGESTINADLVLFGLKDQLLISCRSYNIIKAYLGFAKRDIKYNKDYSRYHHIVRGLYTASCLLNNELPNLKNIQEIKLDSFSKNNKELKSWHDQLRLQCNKLYENNTLPMYPKIYDDYDNIDNLYKKLLDSCNTKEFKYGN